MSKEKIKSEKSKRSIGKRTQHIKVEKMIEEERKQEELAKNEAADQLVSMIEKLERSVIRQKAEYSLQEHEEENPVIKESFSKPNIIFPYPGSETVTGNTPVIKKQKQEIKETAETTYKDESSVQKEILSETENVSEQANDEQCDYMSEEKEPVQETESLPNPVPEQSPGRYNSLANVLITAGAILTVLIMFFEGGYNLLSSKKTEPLTNDKKEDTIPEIIDNKMPEDLRNTWLFNRAINPDYIGNVVFDSGLIDLSIVQATDVYDDNGELYSFYDENGNLITYPEGYNGNDVYIWTNWKTGEYDGNGDGGSVFMDFRNNLNDQNIIIYGHHFARDYDPSGDKLFTPLDLLLEEKNYEANKSLKLILDNEIREYVVTDVFIVDIDNEYELNFMRRNMDDDLSGNPDPGFFKDYIEYVSKVDKYPINESLNESDNMLTLVTCIQHQPQYRELILCKEIKRIVYE